MFITMKKKTAIAVIIAIVLVVTVVITAVSVAAAQRANSGSLGKTIVVDAGHGGRDGGVEGRQTGIKESDINLAIAKKLQTFLEQKGYKVVMTRTNAEGLYGTARNNRKQRDMEARRKIINDASPDLVISIHQNSFPSPSVRGPQVFHSHGSEEGLAKAAIMQTKLNAVLESDRVAKTGDFFILECSPYTSLLIECGFLSNAEEEQLLADATHQEKIAFTISSAVHAIFFGEENSNDE